MLITKDKLDTTIKSMFLSVQLERIGYPDLSDSDIQVALKNANDEMNKLQWIGTKVSDTQSDSWPRVINDEVINTPEQVILAMAQYAYDFIRIMSNENHEAIEMGLTSQSIGPIRETYDIEKADISNKAYIKYLNGLIYRGV